VNNQALKTLKDIKLAMATAEATLLAEREKTGGGLSIQAVVNDLAFKLNMCIGLHVELLCVEAGITLEDFEKLEVEPEDVPEPSRILRLN
jgi:hypothetical protein